MPESAGRAASDYFNSLPIEQRRNLAPLLEEYRRMGIEEALRGLRSVTHDLTLRSRGIAAAMGETDTAPANQRLPRG